MDAFDATWRPAGRLSQLMTDFSSGVYLFVHEGPPKRVIYAGTAGEAGGYYRRWFSHLNLYRTGGRTVWRPRETTDVYPLMSIPYGQYAPACRNAQVWLPSSSKEEGVFTPFYEGAPSYEGDWQEWVLEEYLDEVAVWCCDLPRDEAKILESQIQLTFKEAFDITYYQEYGRQSWLGRVEVTDPDRLSSRRFAFDALPDVEPESRDLLRALAG